jgi:hypothetical protein
MWLLPLPWLIGCTGGAVSDDTGTRTTSSPSVDSGTTDTSPPAPSLPALCVNEIMEDNRETLTDDAGGTPSWIELHNPERTDISLAGWTVTDDETEPDRHVFADDLVVPGLGYLLLYADDETDQGSQHLAFELHKIGGRVTLYDADGTEISYGEWIDEWNSDVARARDTDCCSDLLCWSSQRTGTPGASNVVPERDETVLAEAQAVWRYHDTGETPGPGWREADFDDSAWDSGPAPLGYGDDHQVTEVSYGGDSGDKHPTTWFRRTFQVDDPDAFDDLRLELLYDDGAAVYLNGVEVLRAGLPGGDLTPNTYATRTASGSGETDYSSFTVVPDALVAGENVLAVEVHQAASDSSDLGMDLAVFGEIVLEPR